ncbi:hypothetical protein JYB87_11940 [Shewanella avicenniae]|uniref:Homeodomain-like domain-containing protein n=1 Tax=Shewanella avicenniae TaxID=2814294 RepID=A0ABX7QLZ8_9GAMM|nr:hypothetical protein [Shewanella avicenniae]QSX32476.1 hypothetical protein JYB87_11940 [Shewanella avicenniae]
MASKRQSDKATAAALRPQIIDMRRQGFSIRQIAQHIGKSVGWVHKQETLALDELASETLTETEKYRALQLARYEDMFLRLQTKVKSGDGKAIETARRILDSINRLTGAEAPAKVAPTTPDGKQQYDPASMTPEERRARIAELMGKVGK